MTLALLSSKIAAESNGPKVDGRCYNSRSKNKTRWEMFNLHQLRQKQIRRRKRQGLVRGVYSKAEMAEYKEILRKGNKATTPRAQNAKTS
ncbi:unnamed protein product [Ectocarpus sp. 6 AP-2014]